MCTSPSLSFHPQSYSSLCSREDSDRNSGHILTQTRRIEEKPLKRPLIFSTSWRYMYEKYDGRG